MAYGVTPEGFILKRLADILADIKTDLANVQDPLTGEYLSPDLLDENDPLIQVTNAYADQLSVAWEHLQLAYNQFDPLKATGAGLSGTVQLNALSRKDGSPSTVVLTLTGSPNLVMPAGKKVSLMDDSVIFSLPVVTFDAGGSATVTGICLEDGPNTALAGTVVKIVTPYSGWIAVNNAADASVGTAEETDTALRARQQVSTSSTGRGMVDDLFGAVSNIPDVTYCRVYQNRALVVDERGIDPKTVAVVVLGGADEDIAETIFEHLSLGVATFGGVTIPITDDQGFVYDINFNRPTEIEIYVNISIHPLTADWPTDGKDLVKAAIVGWGALLNPGTAVYASQIYPAVNDVGSLQITALTIGIVDPPTADSVACDWDEVVVFDSARITVTEV